MFNKNYNTKYKIQNTLLQTKYKTLQNDKRGNNTIIEHSLQTLTRFLSSFKMHLITD